MNLLLTKKLLSLFLNFLIKEGVIDQPMSQEKRGLLLYQFCQQTYPSYETEMTLAWIEAGMSLKKRPAYKIRSKHIVPPENWKIIYGTYQNNLRLISLPSDKTGEPTYWYGFEIESQNKRPIFKAIN